MSSSKSNQIQEYENFNEKISTINSKFRNIDFPKADKRISNDMEALSELLIDLELYSGDKLQELIENNNPKDSRLKILKSRY
jgi:hypothetical protein